MYEPIMSATSSISQYDTLYLKSNTVLRAPDPTRLKKLTQS